ESSCRTAADDCPPRDRSCPGRTAACASLSSAPATPCRTERRPARRTVPPRRQRPRRRPRPWSPAKRKTIDGSSVRTSQAPSLLRQTDVTRVVDRVRGQLFNAVIAILERVGGTRLRVDERGDVLRVLVRDVARVKIRHRI